MRSCTFYFIENTFDTTESTTDTIKDTFETKFEVVVAKYHLSDPNNTNRKNKRFNL